MSRRTRTVCQSYKILKDDLSSPSRKGAQVLQVIDKRTHHWWRVPLVPTCITDSWTESFSKTVLVCSLVWWCLLETYGISQVRLPENGAGSHDFKTFTFKVRCLFCVSSFKKGIILWTRKSEVGGFFKFCLLPVEASFFFFLSHLRTGANCILSEGQAGQVFRELKKKKKPHTLS